MSIPDTDDITVAKIAAALQITEKYIPAYTDKGKGFTEFLRYFTNAYEVLNNLAKSGSNVVEARNVIKRIEEQSTGSDASQG